MQATSPREGNREIPPHRALSPRRRGRKSPDRSGYPHSIQACFVLLLPKKRVATLGALHRSSKGNFRAGEELFAEVGDGSGAGGAELVDDGAGGGHGELHRLAEGGAGG